MLWYQVSKYIHRFLLNSLGRYIVQSNVYACRNRENSSFTCRWTSRMISVSMVWVIPFHYLNVGCFDHSHPYRNNASVARREKLISFNEKFMNVCKCEENNTTDFVNNRVKFMINRIKLLWQESCSKRPWVVRTFYKAVNKIILTSK